MAKAKQQTEKQQTTVERLDEIIASLNARLDALEADTEKAKAQVDALRVAGDAFAAKINVLSSRIANNDFQARAEKKAPSRVDR